MEYYEIRGEKGNLVGTATSETIEGVREVGRALGKPVTAVEVSEADYIRLREQQTEALMGDFEEKIASLISKK